MTNETLEHARSVIGQKTRGWNRKLKPETEFGLIISPLFINLVGLFASMILEASGIISREQNFIIIGVLIVFSIISILLIRRIKPINNKTPKESIE